MKPDLREIQSKMGSNRESEVTLHNPEFCIIKIKTAPQATGGSWQNID